jgi:hypothetical protein
MMRRSRRIRKGCTVSRSVPGSTFLYYSIWREITIKIFQENILFSSSGSDIFVGEDVLKYIFTGKVPWYLTNSTVLKIPYIWILLFTFEVCRFWIVPGKNTFKVP